MFKAKSFFKLPDPPKPPTQKMMEEDLMIANNDDELFLLLSSNQENECVPLPLDSNEIVNVNDDQVFTLAMKLSRNCKQLEEDADSLNRKFEHLKTLSISLSENVDDVKKQALTAMSKS